MDTEVSTTYSTVEGQVILDQLTKILLRVQNSAGSYSRMETAASLLTLRENQKTCLDLITKRTKNQIHNSIHFTAGISFSHLVFIKHKTSFTIKRNLINF